MTDVTEILVHWHAGRSQSEIAASLGVDRKTIRKYLAPAVEAGIVPGDEPRAAAWWRGQVGVWFPSLVDARLRQVTWDQFDAQRDYIVAQRQAGVTVATISQRLRDAGKVSASESSLRRWLAATVPDEAVARERVTVLGPPAVAGEHGQVDYSLMGSWTNPATGSRHRIWVFSLVLAFSRHMFIWPTIRMDQHAWCDAHVRAFEFFGGVPARVVPDNLKTGVLKSDLYDPQLNPAYAELGEHYGILIDPARAYRPKDKPKVERPNQYVRDSWWRGRQFTSLAHMQADARAWCTEVAGRRAHRSLDGAAPLTVFEAAEVPALRALPARAFELARWSVAKVAPDIHVKVGKTLYSVPWKHLGERVHIRATATTVQIFTGGRVLIATHPTGHGKVTDWAHYPPEKIAFQMRGPQWCLKTAKTLGPAVVEVIDQLLAVGVLHRLRAAQGVIRLADKYGPDRLDAACRLALDAGDPEYKTIKGILAAGRDQMLFDLPTAAGAGATTAAFLRGKAAIFAATHTAGTVRTTTARHRPHEDDNGRDGHQRDDDREDRHFDDGDHPTPTRPHLTLVPVTTNEKETTR